MVSEEVKKMLKYGVSNEKMIQSTKASVKEVRKMRSSEPPVPRLLREIEKEIKIACSS